MNIPLVSVFLLAAIFMSAARTVSGTPWNSAVREIEDSQCLLQTSSVLKDQVRQKKVSTQPGASAGWHPQTSNRMYGELQNKALTLAEKQHPHQLKASSLLDLSSATGYLFRGGPFASLRDRSGSGDDSVNMLIGYVVLFAIVLVVGSFLMWLFREKPTDKNISSSVCETPGAPRSLSRPSTSVIGSSGGGSSHHIWTLSPPVAETAEVFIVKSFVEKDLEEKCEDGSEYSDNEDHHQVVDMCEDTYGMAITSLIRDSHRMAQQSGSTSGGLRVVRVVTTLALLWGNIAIQVFLLAEIKQFATARAVHDIRDSYNNFENIMYDNHTHPISPGRTAAFNDQVRGDSSKNFHPERFAALSEDDKDAVCSTPFSQPLFYYVILAIWSFTCAAEITAIYQLFYRLVLKSETPLSMLHAIEHTGEGTEVIRGVTRNLKLFLSAGLLLPRLCVVCYLLWLGCRWLTATNNFVDLVLNAVALEFVLLLKDLFYNALVPSRNKRETCNTKINVAFEGGRPSLSNYMLAFSWAAIVALWVWVYSSHLQTVLPEYRYDVHDVCSEWISERYAV